MGEKRSPSAEEILNIQAGQAVQWQQLDALEKDSEDLGKIIDDLSTHALFVGGNDALIPDTLALLEEAAKKLLDFTQKVETTVETNEELAKKIKDL